MTALQNILAQYRAVARTEREKGTYFEELMLCYFRNEASYKDLYAKRAEFWYWVLFVWLMGGILLYLDLAFYPEKAAVWIYPMMGTFNLIIALPSLAVGCRCLHDIGRGGWWQLLGLTGLGTFLLFYWWACEGDSEYYARAQPLLKSRTSE